MSIDTSGLFGWASPDAIEGAAPALGKGGTSYLQSVEDAADTWRQLNAHYEGDGAAEIVDVFRTVTPHAELLEQTAKEAGDTLLAFASGIRWLQIRRDQLMVRVEAADSRAEQEATQCLAPADPLAPSPPVDLLLPAEVAALTNDYRALEEETAAKLLTVVLGDDAFVNEVTNKWGTAVTGFVGAAAKLATSRQTVVKVPTAKPVYVRYETSAERIRHMARGRWVSDGIWKLTSVNTFELRPQPSKLLYNTWDGYKNRVDADPSKWATTPGKFSELTNSAKGFKIGGGALTLVTAGLTVKDERQDAYNELLQANPGMDPDELDKRADAMGAVKGGTKAGIDLGAAAAGAMIGTAIGGPVGTVAGAAIGIGISVITSVEFDFLGGKSIKDVAADGIMNAADDFMESDLMKSDAGKAARKAADNVAEAAGDCWNKLFGK
ncbi:MULTISPECIES: hypothetical protein [Arthrobacter]|uniref:Uncharacterized protein n=1 Tax=Arthrobacter jinronghuae TaxID=2964609 RepID=A0ABT1NNN1_9MICC|nr:MULTISPECIES: hypothetical protein [Arthrobacter]MCQ1949330.1 hypothetical protein [Arthrobacter jinronghuae]MCQ1952651.1 hypothetical protein [Arthrobacter sp. zg-Y238]MCQ1955226.1 hypothetical protein [Arthrobacter jinronghuae]UWX77891.1 hypothetical protein N2K98_13035 [Arthrobacter jinronghuae]